MAKENGNTVLGQALTFGQFVIDAGKLASMQALVGEAGRNARGIVLANVREKLTLNVPRSADPTDIVPAEFTVTVTVQRSAVTAEESHAIATAKAIQDGKANERKSSEAKKLDAAEKRMFELGQNSTLSTLGQFDRIARGAAALNLGGIGAAAGVANGQ